MVDSDASLASMREGRRERAKRPVMFWIHGGGFQAGSGSSPGGDGKHLAATARKAALVIHDESKLVDDPTRERRIAMQALLGLR